MFGFLALFFKQFWRTPAPFAGTIGLYVSDFWFGLRSRLYLFVWVLKLICRRYFAGFTGRIGQDLAEVTGAGAVVAAGQVHARQGDHRVAHYGEPRGGRRHRGRNQRRTRSQEGRRRIRHGT